MKNSPPDILKKILHAKEKRLKYLKSLDISALGKRAINFIENNPPISFTNALKKSKLAIIAEIKKASPSAGIIKDNFEPAKIAKSYKNQGADAISVLTEEDFFLGKPEYIEISKKNAPNLPILRKDFIFHPAQVYESAILKADSFLLICAILEFKKLKSLIELGRSLKMEPLVETHSSDEIKMALDAGATIIGVNNRNLRTFQVNIDTSLELVSLIPSNKIKVSESGIKSPSDCKKLRDAGYDAVLIGETLMKTTNLNIEDLKF